jgi:hypothetical protein
METPKIQRISEYSNFLKRKNSYYPLGYSQSLFVEDVSCSITTSDVELTKYWLVTEAEAEAAVDEECADLNEADGPDMSTEDWSSSLSTKKKAVSPAGG